MISGDQDTVEEGQQNNVILPQTEDSLIPADEAHKLDPPLSAGENMRDALLQILDSTFFQYLGIVVLIGVVASGAVFFFFLMGWQVTRIVYYNYDLQNEFPGNMWTNIFFGLSMICAAIGGSLMGYHTGKVRATDPERFGLGPVELVRDMYHKIFHREGPSERENDAPGAEPHRTRASEAVESEFDPTRAPSRRSVIDVNRSSLRMFAL
eukprot:scaffold2767_cov177-Amphora_coffeaeformis.AAC.46